MMPSLQLALPFGWMTAFQMEGLKVQLTQLVMSP